MSCLTQVAAALKLQSTGRLGFHRRIIVFNRPPEQAGPAARGVAVVAACPTPPNLMRRAMLGLVG
jgi:hypothetical protein